MSEPNYPESVARTYRDLSSTSKKLLDFLLDHPAAAHPCDFSKVTFPEEFLRHRDPLQNWPILIDNRKLEQYRQATVNVTRLVRDVPRLLFDNDPGKFADFFGLEDELLMSLLLAAPTGLEASLARCDFIDSEKGLRCVELNHGAFLGGWELRFLKPHLLDQPPIREFMAEEGLEPFYRDPFAGLMRHLVRQIQAASLVEGNEEMHIVFAVDQEALEPALKVAPYFNKLLAEQLREMGEIEDARISICSYPGELELGEGMRAFLRGKPVHAVVEYAYTSTPREVFCSFKAELLKVFNGPLSHYFSDKRLLALLSEAATSDRLSAEEKAIVRDHLPWSRLVRDTSVSFEDAEIGLLELLRSQRERFVLKPGHGSRGDGVRVGRFQSAKAWERHLDEAVEDGKWVAQEYIPSRPYLFQNGEAGVDIYEAVWGTFCFGDEYGGGFLRLMPRQNSDGVINTARGAVDGLILEI